MLCQTTVQKNNTGLFPRKKMIRNTIDRLDEYQKHLIEQSKKGGKVLQKQAGHLLKVPQRLLWAFVTEGMETKDMMVTFVKHGKRVIIKKDGKEGPTEEELQKALAQLKDIPRILPFFVITVVPAPGITEGYVILALTLEKWLGQKISLLPSGFRNLFGRKEEKDENAEEA